MFKNFLVSEQFYNEIAVQIKIIIEIEFSEYLKTQREGGSKS